MPPFVIEVADPRGAEARECLDRYYAELDDRFEDGFDLASYPALTAEELTLPSGVFLVATLDGEPVGCGALTTRWPSIGLITRMWVAGAARGTGLGGRILDELERHAAKLGQRAVRLDTNRVLIEAQALYRNRGYREVAPFNDNPCAHLWFEKNIGEPSPSEP